jgi:hypothetical protein
VVREQQEQLRWSRSYRNRVGFNAGHWALELTRKGEGEVPGMVPGTQKTEHLHCAGSETLEGHLSRKMSRKQLAGWRRVKESARIEVRHLVALQMCGNKC